MFAFLDQSTPWVMFSIQQMSPEMANKPLLEDSVHIA